MNSEEAIRLYRLEPDVETRLELLSEMEETLPEQGVLEFLCEVMMASGASLDERLEAAEIVKVSDPEASKESMGLGERLAAFLRICSDSSDLDLDEYLVANQVALCLGRFPLTLSARRTLRELLLDKSVDRDLRFNIFDAYFASRSEDERHVLGELQGDPVLGGIAQRYLDERV